MLLPTAVPLLLTPPPLLVAPLSPAPATAALPSLLLAYGEIGGPISDLAFVAAFIVIAGFGGKSVFDSIFIENDEFQPPMPNIKLPGMADDEATIVAKAEELREQLQAAIAAEDMQGAFAAEKALKNHLAENGLTYYIDEAPEAK